ncbi:MAG: DNA polymerase III subunit delta' C-terminal domain-containing protein [Candidatus Omnitrophota bacterium]|nr:DNA polymerase III subunit delta' C-terminal domain-containing protein [Candidatus Omnitrophota bacterium]
MKLNEIKGHERPISILLNSLKTNRLACSYLFVGPSGIGKAGVAKYLSSVLNCEKNNFEACGKCLSCQKIENANHPDVHWIVSDTSGFIKIEQVRGLSREINLKPFEARAKVFIILDVQNLTEEASNCLLKTLEEPPFGSLIILTTSQIKRLSPTLISRCLRIVFSGIHPEILKDILVREYNQGEDISHYLSYFYEGRLGKTLSFINANVMKDKNQIINNFTNLSNAVFLDDSMLGDKQKVREALLILIYWFRDIMLLKLGIDLSYLVNCDRKKDLLMLQGRYSIAEVINALKDIINTNIFLEQNLNLKITLSLLREKLCKEKFM